MFRPIRTRAGFANFIRIRRRYNSRTIRYNRHRFNELRREDHLSRVLMRICVRPPPSFPDSGRSRTSGLGRDLPVRASGTYRPVTDLRADFL